MSWAKLDDGLPNNPKVEGLSDRAFRLYVGSICYCARNFTGGALTAKATRIVCAEAAALKKHVGELHDAGLWDRTGDGYLVHDYLKYNPSTEDAKERQEQLRQIRSDAGRRGADARWHGKRDGKSATKIWQPEYAPVPSRKDQKPLEATISEELRKAALTGPIR